MAYSDDTQAIIDRLKAEGDLIRNTGTNSVRSLNVKLEKFDGLFQSINTNIIQQTAMMEQNMGLTIDAAERSRTKEQFDEIAQKEDIADKKESKRADKKPLSEVGNKAGDALAKGFNKIFTLKNMAAMGAIGFVGANFLKGFVEEYGGFKNLLKEMGVSDETLNSFDTIGEDVNKMKLQFSEFIGPEGPITKMTTSLGDISVTLGELNKKFQTILEMDWGTIAAVAFGALSTFGVVMSAIRLRLEYMRLTLKDGLKPINGRTWFQRFLGIDPKNDPKAPKGEGTPKGTNTNPKGNNPNRQGQTKPFKGSGGGGGGGVVLNTDGKTVSGSGQSKADLRAAAVKNGLKMNSAGRLINAAGSYVSDADALKMMMGTLDARYSAIFQKLIKFFKFIKITYGIVVLFQIWSILSNDTAYPTDEDKMRALAPILGELLGVLGGAAIFGGIATMTGIGAGWGTLALGFVGGVVGGFAGSKLGYYVAKWAFDMKVTDEMKQEVMSVAPRPTGSGRNARGKQMNWDGKYGQTHNPDGSVKASVIKTLDNTANIASSATANMTSAEAKRAADAADAAAAQANIMADTDQEILENQKMIDEIKEKYLHDSGFNTSITPGKRTSGMVLAGLGGGNAVNVFNSTNNSPHFFNTHHGNHAVTTTRVAVGDGSGAGGSSLAKYGITGFA